MRTFSPWSPGSTFRWTRLNSRADTYAPHIHVYVHDQHTECNIVVQGHCIGLRNWEDTEAQTPTPICTEVNLRQQHFTHIKIQRNKALLCTIYKMLHRYVWLNVAYINIYLYLWKYATLQIHMCPSQFELVCVCV